MAIKMGVDDAATPTNLLKGIFDYTQKHFATTLSHAAEEFVPVCTVGILGSANASRYFASGFARRLARVLL
jgi:hypothetical protein